MKTFRGDELWVSDEPIARFMVLDSGKLGELEKVESDAKLPVLARVSVLLQFGLLDEAESLLDSTVEQYPSSNLAKKLRDNLIEQRK